MTGTLAGALEARGIPAQDNLVADVEGRIEGEEKLFRITAVQLRYRFKIPKGKRAESDRALEIHERYCPIRQSLQRGFAVTWFADIAEAE
ncbi:MAG: OsmC family protein [Acidobacteria bacterium]|nr:OsmC family protein [Acidobacteriota bacterium]